MKNLADILQEVTEQMAREFETFVSKPRFKRYRRIYPVVDPKHPQERHPLDAIAIYQWNTALCEALYPTLLMLEITFRNALDAAMTAEKDTSRWYDDAFLLQDREQRLVMTAKEEVAADKKPLEPAHVVAQLMLGFWVGLYSEPYEQSIVRLTVVKVFPNLHPKQRTSRHFRPRLQQSRNLRNRVFHYEPIWHWPELVRQYEETVEMVHWINRDAGKLLSLTDRFREVYDAGWHPYRDKLDEMLFDEAVRIEAEEAAK